jgi:hypothetical protein
MTRFDDWHAIHTLIMSCAERVDAGRYADAATLFEHATFRREFKVDGRTEFETFRGTAGVNAWLARSPLFSDGTPRTRHVHTNLIIELDGDAASSRCYVSVFQQTPALPLQPIAVGRYIDSFERMNGQWRFTDRLLTGFLLGNIGMHQAKT